MESAGSGGGGSASDVEDASEHFGATFVEQSRAIRATIQRAGAGATPGCRPNIGTKVCVRVRPTLEHEQQLLGQRIPGMSDASFAQFDYESCLCDRDNRDGSRRTARTRARAGG